MGRKTSSRSGISMVPMAHSPGFSYSVGEGGVVESTNVSWLRKSKPGKSGKGHKQKQGPDQLVPCRYCGMSIRPETLLSHLKTCNTKAVATINPTLEVKNKPEHTGFPVFESSSVADLRQLVACPFCNSKVRQTRLQRHISRVHAAESQKSQSKFHTQNQSKRPTPPLPLPKPTKAKTRKPQPRHEEYSVINPAFGLIEELVQRDGEAFVRDFCEAAKRKVSPDAILGWLTALRSNGLPLTLQNAISLREKQTQAAIAKIGLKHSGAKRGNRLGRDSGYQGKNPTSQNTDSGGDKHKQTPAAFSQSHDEPMYGDKYLGQMRRESDGKFGSLPLYDDFGDESDAD